MVGKDIKYDAIIVGAGFSGLYMMHKLRKAGFSAHEVTYDDGSTAKVLSKKA